VKVKSFFTAQDAQAQEAVSKHLNPKGSKGKQTHFSSRLSVAASSATS
jgi:hypothetical protein